MSRLDAEKLARLYEGFYSEEPFSGPIPRCVLEPIPDCNPSRTSPLEVIAGFAVLAFVAIVFGVML